MELLPLEEELYRRIRRTLSDRETTKRLENEDVSQEDIYSLLKSENRDLPHLGLDILSLLPSLPDALYFSRDEQVAGNFLRFFLALDAAGLSTRELQNQVFENLMFSELLRDYGALKESTSTGSSPAYQPNVTMTVIIHGTWSNPPDKWWFKSNKPWWWEPGGNFWNHINNLTGDVYAGNDYYKWTGYNSDKARIQGASDLVTWCQGKNYQILRVIAHSHGGNVAMYASRLGLEIDNLILLGTPIRVDYIPDFPNIRKLTNIFSTGDWIQQPGTFPHRRNEGQTLADSDKVLNIQAIDAGNGHDPGHGELHEPGTWTASHLDRLL